MPEVAQKHFPTHNQHWTAIFFLPTTRMSASSGSEMKVWVQKIKRSTGQVMWSKVYNRPNDNIRGRLEKVNDGGFLLVPYNQENSAQADAMLAKIDANGNLLWSHNYGGHSLRPFDESGANSRWWFYRRWRNTQQQYKREQRHSGRKN
jgi:hypothetical protein